MYSDMSPLFQYLFFDIIDWQVTDDWRENWHKFYFYVGGTTRQTPYIYSSVEPSRMPIIKGNVVIVQFRQGPVKISSFKIKYMAYSVRPESSDRDVGGKNHDDVIEWKHFPRYWSFVRGIHRSPVNSPHKGPWRGALMFTLICTRINGWVNNREADDLRRNRVHYDVIVMFWLIKLLLHQNHNHADESAY